MRTKIKYMCTSVFFVLITVFILGCALSKDENKIIQPNSQGSPSNDFTIADSTKTKINDISKIENPINSVGEFIKAIENTDAEGFKRIISPSGLIVIRNFPSGFGERGKDVRNIYSIDKIPSDIQFKISDEVPVNPKDILKKSQEINIADISIEEIDDINFNLKDNASGEIISPPTTDIVDICGEIVSTQDTDINIIPKIFILGGSEIVLTESQLCSGWPTGTWVVFEKSSERYLLRGIIDLR